MLSLMTNNLAAIKLRKEKRVAKKFEKKEKKGMDNQHEIVHVDGIVLRQYYPR